MLAYTYIKQGEFALLEKPKPQLQDAQDAIVRVSLASICTSDLHIKHGSVPRAVPGITVGHEMVGVVEEVGAAVTNVKPGDRVTVNVETFCGECFFCQHGFVNNCTDKNGGWALGCRIDGGQAEYVRVPYANQGLNRIPDTVTDEQALFTGDLLATGFWAARISDIHPEDTVLILGAGPTGLCTLACVLQKQPKCVIVCEKDEARRAFSKAHYPQALVVSPDKVLDFTKEHSAHGGADVVRCRLEPEDAGADEQCRGGRRNSGEAPATENPAEAKFLRLLARRRKNPPVKGRRNLPANQRFVVFKLFHRTPPRSISRINFLKFRIAYCILPSTVLIEQF